MDVVKHFQLYGYALSLKNRSEKRRGILLRLEGKDHIGWGEIAPLPGWSVESLEEALVQLKEALSSKEIRPKTLFPSIAFGIESALSPHRGGKFPLSGLLSGSIEEMRTRAEELIALGCKSAKMKIAHLPLSAARAFIEEFKDKLKLRIDLNRAWNSKQVIDFFSHFPQDTFDYIEEPVKEFSTLTSFSHPLAMDESFREQATNLSLCKALIWKPSLQKREELPLEKDKIVLSSAYESGVGISRIAALGMSDKPMGLDTYNLIEEDLIEERFLISEGCLHIPERLTIKTKLLTPL